MPGSDLLAKTVTQLHLALSLCLTGFSIYWMIGSGSVFWRQAVGAGIFVASLFLCLLSLAAFAFTLASLIGPPRALVQQLRVVTVLLSLGLCGVTLLLSTFRKADRYYQDILEYGRGNPGADAVTAFLSAHPTYRSRESYVLRWSADLNGPMADLMTVWAGVAILDFVSHLRGILAESEG
jgi:hypothetical protein